MWIRDESGWLLVRPEETISSCGNQQPVTYSLPRCCSKKWADRYIGTRPVERATCRQARIGEHFMCLMSLTASIYINLYINVALLRLVEHRVVTRSSMSMNKKAQQQCFNIMPACCCCWSGCCCCCRKGIHATLFTFLSSSLPFPSRSFFVELQMNPTNEPTMS